MVVLLWFAIRSVGPSMVGFSKAGSKVTISGSIGVFNGMLGPVPSVGLLTTPEGDAVSSVLMPNTVAIALALRASSKVMVSDLRCFSFVFILLLGKAWGPTVVNMG